MSSSRGLLIGVCVAALVAGCNKAADSGSNAAAGAAVEGPGLGQPITPMEIAAIDITIDPDGSNLPAGQGSVSEGLAVYEKHCMSCHGPAGKGEVTNAPTLTGGVRSLATPKPLKTVNSFWNSAPKIFDYIRRTMPPLKPQSLTNDEVYAVTAYLLSIDNVVSPNAVLDAKTLSAVHMPNEKGYIPVAEFMAKPKAPKS